MLKVKILKEEEIIIAVEDTIQHHHNKEIGTNINMEDLVEEVEIAVDPADLVEVETVEGDSVGVEMVVDAVEVVETRNQEINNTMST